MLDKKSGSWLGIGAIVLAALQEVIAIGTAIEQSETVGHKLLSLPLASVVGPVAWVLAWLWLRKEQHNRFETLRLEIQSTTNGAVNKCNAAADNANAQKVFALQAETIAQDKLNKAREAIVRLEALEKNK